MGVYQGYGENALEIIYEDKELLVVYKEAGIATQTKSLTETDLESDVKNYIASSTKEKNPYLGLINRLDQPVEGLVLFGKTKKVTSILNRDLQAGKIEKWYYALCYGKRKEQKEKLEHFLVKNQKTNCTKIGKKEEKDAKYACLFCEVIEDMNSYQLLKIKLETGRHHQIRIQLSETGTPLIGDKKYGSKESINFSLEKNVKFPALCACRLRFPHPFTGKEIDLRIRPKNFIQGVCFDDVCESN